MTGPNAAADRRLDGVCWRSGRPPPIFDCSGHSGEPALSPMN